MKIFDLHQDLMTHIRFKDVLGQQEQTSFEVLVESEVDLVVTTAFPMPPNDDQLHELVSDLISEELEMYRAYIDEHNTWQLVQTAADVTDAQKKILLHLEGLNVFDGSPDAWQQLDAWIDAGVRSIGTHWNIANQLGGGTQQPELPLTTLGAEVIAYLEDKRIIFDMAHMGRQAFIDAAKITTRPLYVSHGNVDAVCSNVRNYTDEQLKMIAVTDGVIGVFFANTFVVGTQRQGTINDVIAHIDYIKNLIGVRHIALGSDFGGIVSGGIQDLEHVRDFPNLINALRESGYSEDDIAAIAYQNAQRVLQNHLR